MGLPYSRFMAWSDEDRGIVLALLLEQKETCPQCGHPVELCRDRKHRGKWQVVEDTCYPSVVAAKVMDSLRESKADRGVVISTRRTGV